MLSYMRQGSILVKQGDRNVTITEGDCFLISSTEPSFLETRAFCDVTSLIFSRMAFQRWVPVPSDLAARPLCLYSPFGKSLAALLEALTPSSLETLAVVPDAVLDHVFCLLALIAGPAGTVSTSYRQAAFHRFLQSLQAHCCDQGFDQTALAKKHGVSTRTIQSTFSLVGTNFGRELLSARMEKARWFLENPRHNKKSIAEIAELLGYRHASLFITQFRRTFGISPAAYRRIRSGPLDR